MFSLIQLADNYWSRSNKVSTLKKGPGVRHNLKIVLIVFSLLDGREYEDVRITLFTYLAIV
jgi:hypothetical protein